MTDAIAIVTIGVADMEPVRSLWVDVFGLEIAATRSGPDADLARLWNIAPERIADQLLLRTPGADTGWLHFVQFTDPDKPVRRGAAPTDLGPKNIDVNCIGMAARHAELVAAGYTFRSDIAEYRVDDIHVLEVQMPGHDDTNIVLVEILSAGFEVEYSPAGYGAVTSFVIVVPDARAEADFYRDVLGLDEVMHHRITGPGIEKAVGLPKGAALDMRLMGRERNLFGRVELIEYVGLGGTDRFGLAKPPATGALHIGFAAPSIGALTEAALGIEAHDFGAVDLIYGRGRVAALRSPAGLRIELFESSTATGPI